MRKTVSTLLLTILFLTVQAQHRQHSLIHSHNDYERPEPFYNAYKHEVASIEADIFARDGQLLVAHTEKEIDPERTLEKLYLDPLQEAIEKNKGYVFDDKSRSLILLIDLKSKGEETMDELISHLQKYPSLVKSSSLKIVISGNVPDPGKWLQYPSWIFFDGRPQIQYHENALNRIFMISDSFYHYIRTSPEGDKIPDIPKNPFCR